MKRRGVLHSIALLPWWPLASHAHGSKLGNLTLRHPYTYPTLNGATTAAVYLVAIRNAGELPDRLLSASSPVADRVAVHQMRMEGDVMRMHTLPFLEIPAKTALTFQPGNADGLHLMLLGLRRSVAVGEGFPLTLRFERAGEVQVEVKVEPRRAVSHHTH